MAREKKRKPTFTERVSLGLRVSPHIKEKLDEAAKKSGRSQSTEAAYRLEQSFERQQLLDDALALKFGRAGAGILLALALTMDRAGRAYLANEAWRDVPKGAHIQDVDPVRWERALTMHWTDDPSSMQVGMMAGIVALAMLSPLNASLTSDDLLRPIGLIINSLFFALRKGELPATLDQSTKEDLTTIRALLSPNMLSRPDESLVDDADRAFYVLEIIAQALRPRTNTMPKEQKP